MCHEYKLACLNWCCHLLPCFDGELYLVYQWKMFIVSALSNMRAWNEASGEPKTQPSHKRVCWSTVCWKVQKSSYPHSVWKMKVIVLGVFCGCNGKTSTVCHQWTTWSLPSKQGSYSATVSTGYYKQICTHSTLWRQHCITCSKEYLTNSHIMTKYFKLFISAAKFGKTFV